MQIIFVCIILYTYNYFSFFSFFYYFFVILILENYITEIYIIYDDKLSNILYET